MENNRLDPLEQLFKSRLEDDSPSADKWNVPPNGLIQNVIVNLAEAKKKKREERQLLFFYSS